MTCVFSLLSASLNLTTCVNIIKIEHYDAFSHFTFIENSSSLSIREFALLQISGGPEAQARGHTLSVTDTLSSKATLFMFVKFVVFENPGKGC